MSRPEFTAASLPPRLLYTTGRTPGALCPTNGTSVSTDARASAPLVVTISGAVAYFILLPPGRKGFSEHARAGCSFFERNDGATIVVIDDRNIKPGAFVEKRNVACSIDVNR